MPAPATRAALGSTSRLGAGWDSEKSGTTALDPGRVKTLFSRSQDPKQMTGTLVLPAGQRLISPIRERSQRSWSDA